MKQNLRKATKKKHQKFAKPGKGTTLAPRASGCLKKCIFQKKVATVGRQHTYGKNWNPKTNKSKTIFSWPETNPKCVSGDQQHANPCHATSARMPAASLRCFAPNASRYSTPEVRGGQQQREWWPHTKWTCTMCLCIWSMNKFVALLFVVVLNCF